jgi:PAS domain S-box-containing protein
MAHLDQLNERIRQLELEIAESRKAIGDIQREQLFSEKVLDSLPGIFYLYDEDGNLIRWNKEHETLTGYNAEELPARSMLEWFSGTDKTRVAERVNLLFENGGRVDVEAHLIIKSGQKFRIILPVCG